MKRWLGWGEFSKLAPKQKIETLYKKLTVPHYFYFMDTIKFLLGAISTLVLLFCNPAYAQKVVHTECPKISKHFDPDRIELRRGRVDLPEFNAYVDVPDNLRFISTAEARSFLHFELQKSACEVQPFVGLFVSPTNWQKFGHIGYEDNWIIDVTYDASYVSDEDAISTNYQEMIQQVRESFYDHERASYQWGGSKSYAHVMGWALPPEYDPKDQTAIWSLHILHGDRPDYTVPIRAIRLGAKSNFRLDTRGLFSKNEENRETVKKAISSIKFQDGWKFSDRTADSIMNRSKTIGTVIAETIFVERATPLTWKEYIYAIFFGLLKIIYHYLVHILAFITIFIIAFTFSKIKRSLLLKQASKEPFFDYESSDRVAEAEYAGYKQASTTGTDKPRAILLNGNPLHSETKF